MGNELHILGCWYKLFLASQNMISKKKIEFIIPDDKKIL